MIAETLFPRTLDRGATLHNTYIQILAEAGVVGFLTFLAALITIGIGIVPPAARHAARIRRCS